MGFYEEMRDEVASPLLAEFKQGTVTLSRPGSSTPGENPWDPPVEGEPVVYTLDAVAKGVSKEYINGTTILATDLEVTASVVAHDADGADVSVVPDFATDTITVDGRTVELVRDLSIPAAGVKLAYRWIVRG
jgi:hypothetical protein